MKILGIGVDIVQNKRIKDLIKNKIFINRTFGKKEIMISKKFLIKQIILLKGFQLKKR